VLSGVRAVALSLPELSIALSDWKHVLHTYYPQIALL